MTDRELLKLAAKAAAIEHGSDRLDCGLSITLPGGRHHSLPRWNPLEDDGDALRLAAKLKIDIEWQATNPFPEPRVEAYQRNDEGTHFCADEREDDYRRAIVRAAAAIGEAMP